MTPGTIPAGTRLVRTFFSVGLADFSCSSAMVVFILANMEETCGCGGGGTDSSALVSEPGSASRA